MSQLWGRANEVYPRFVERPGKDWSDFPGAPLVRAGLANLGRGVETSESLLVATFASRLRRGGLEIPTHTVAEPERRLYLLLAAREPDAAHSRYNALRRRLVSFARALECAELADSARIRAFMRALGERAESECRVYFTGGTSAVLEGWRHTTVDVDMLLVPDSDRLLQQVPELKEHLHLNVELASPAHFIPELPGWDRRSPFIERSGRVSFYHYDFYAQALAKVERGEERDFVDVRAMLERGLVTRALLWQHFREIEPTLYRFPAIHAPAFRGALESAIGSDSADARGA